MKKTYKLLALAFALAFSITGAVYLHANTTQMASPAWGQGKPVANATTKMGIQPNVNAGVADCSAGAVQASILSTTSTVINVTSTTNLSPSGTIPYTAGFKAFVVNTNPTTTLVAFVSTTATTIAGTTPAGQHILAGQSAFIDIASRDGIALHLQGLTGTSSANVTICNY